MFIRNNMPVSQYMEEMRTGVQRVVDTIADSFPRNIGNNNDELKGASVATLEVHANALQMIVEAFDDYNIDTRVPKEMVDQMRVAIDAVYGEYDFEAAMLKQIMK